MDEQARLAGAMERLTKVVGDLEKDFYQKRTFWWSFSHGLLYGLGTVIGATILVAVIVFVLTKLQAVPGLAEPTQGIIQNIRP